MVSNSISRNTARFRARSCHRELAKRDETGNYLMDAKR